MKILFDHPSPFALAHGGFQVQIDETKAGLERKGIEVEYLRWWDEKQTGDLIHYFGAPSVAYLKAAREKHIPVVLTNLFTATCNRSPLQLKVQGAVTRSLLSLPGWNIIKNQLHWRSFQAADHMIVGLEAEKLVLTTVFGLPDDRISIVPLGMNEDFLTAGKPSRNEAYLITTGTITGRKRSVELALMAREAEVPILFVGKPYDRADHYWKKFQALIDNRFVLHHEHVEGRAEMIALLKSSRGFVIYSTFENWCLSAHEAIACSLPVLVPDLPWSRECFGEQASYLDSFRIAGNAGKLRSFYDNYGKLTAPAIKLYSWDDVAERLLPVYRRLLG
jgi:glycosyltransferase involved in cell wall biosynthesis